MPIFSCGTVESVRRLTGGVLEGAVRLDSGEKAKVLIIESMTGGAAVGDRLVLNTTAVELKLGSGGYHFALWNLTDPKLAVPSKGHVMKLRYTPLQLNVEAIEESLRDAGKEPSELRKTLEGMPVIAGSVHSQLMPAVIGFKHASPQGRLVYIMTDGGSLPLGLSRTVALLRERGLIDSTISCGHAFGGDYEAVNVPGALCCARNLLGADAAVVMMGPGIVGTRSALGFSGTEQAQIIDFTAALGGHPVGALRLSFADPRTSHRGVSHHSMTVFGVLTLARALIAVPEIEDIKKMELILGQLESSGITGRHELRKTECAFALDALKEYGFPWTFMGRGPDEEPEFFMAAAAAGALAGMLLQGRSERREGGC